MFGLKTMTRLLIMYMNDFNYYCLNILAKYVNMNIKKNTITVSGKRY